LAGEGILQVSFPTPSRASQFRFNPDLKAKYDKLKAAGKAFKLAITAIMRKLIVLANTLAQAQQKMAAIMA
jgi:transposase